MLFSSGFFYLSEMMQPESTFFKTTLNQWQPLYEETLAKEDAEYINKNITNFFNILMKWEDRANKRPQEDSSAKEGTNN